MSLFPNKMEREKATLRDMLEIYCEDVHCSQSHPCANCQVVLHYAYERLEHCPFQEEKSTCAECLVHCYKREMRMHIREVMRHAGPKMVTRHPIKALFHMLNGLRKPKSLDQLKAERE